LGTVYELSPSADGHWKEEVLVRFNGSPINTPYGSLVMDSLGNLYGSAAGYNTDSLGGIYEVVR